MPILLNVPYAEKDQAKAMGAYWHPRLKKWYVKDRREYVKFAKWFDSQLIVTDHIYIVEGTRRCFRCRKNTTVIGFGINSWFDIYGDRCYPYDDMFICPIESTIPDILAIQLERRYGFKKGYSQMAQSTCYANHCCHCGSMQGNYYLFDEEDSPFFIYDEKDAKRLVLRKIDLPCDISVSTTFSYGSKNSLIKKYSTFTNSDIRWMDISEEDIATLYQFTSSSHEIINSYGNFKSQSKRIPSSKPVNTSKAKRHRKDHTKGYIVTYFIVVANICLVAERFMEAALFLLTGIILALVFRKI